MSNITGNFKVGDKIRFKAGRGKARACGRVREITEHYIEVNYWREKRQRVPHYQDDHWLEHDRAPHAHPRFGGPGIGAVVAMVAAARMVLGDWSDGRGLTGTPVTHWDFVEPWMSCLSHAACGTVYPDDYSPTSGIEDVDCPACLAIHARVYGKVQS